MSLSLYTYTADLLTNANFTVTLLALLGSISLWYTLSFVSWRKRMRGFPLAPGPPSFPIVGNFSDMPKSRPWIRLRELSTQYGDVMYLRVFNQSILVLGSAEVILEFLEKRSTNTSDRKQVASFALAGNDWFFGLMPYGPLWKLYRRVFWKHFHPGAISAYRPAQSAVTHKFLMNLWQSPQKIENHIMHSVSASLLKIAYGIDASDDNDETIAAIDTGVEAIRQLVLSSEFLVDALPVLRHYPSWLPGGGFLRRFAEWKKATSNLRDAPMERYRKGLDTGELQPCVVSNLLTSYDSEYKPDRGHPIDPYVFTRNLAAGIFQAGSETTSSALEVFFLAMSLYPDVQKKAQAEILAVVGRDRLPDINDRDSLTYVNAIIKECFRWMPIAPLGVAHSTIEDDEYRGYFIPRGTVIITNLWACMQDENVYKVPGVFQPERFIRENGTLDTSVRDPENLIFGFGRRICPGRYFAMESMFVIIASVLHVFDIAPPLDENGKEIKIEPRMVDCPSSHPEDCRCTIKPRGPWAEALITSAGHYHDL